MMDISRSSRIFSSVVVMAFIFSPAQSSLCWKSIEPLRQHFPTTSFAEQMSQSSEPSVELMNFVDPKDNPAKPVIGGDCTNSGRGYGPNENIIHVTTAKSWMACQRVCEEFEECAYFNLFLIPKVDNCTLYHSRAKLLHADGVISGPKRCGNPFSCFQSGINMPGNDIIEIPEVSAAEECKRKCLQHPGCEYFFQGRHCWLKTKAAVANTENSDIPNSTLGSKSCHPQWCFMHDISLNTTGANVVTKLTDVVSAIVCQRKCQENGECMLWTYKSNNDCFLLKSDFTQQTSFDAISGWKFCGDPKDKVIDGNFPGPDIRSFQRISSVDDCIVECYKDPRCYFFTYNKKESKCFLHPREANLRSGSCNVCVKGAVIPGIGNKLL